MKQLIINTTESAATDAADIVDSADATDTANAAAAVAVTVDDMWIFYRLAIEKVMAIHV